MKIYIGSDHRGYSLKANLITYLRSSGYDVEDNGDEKLDPNDDYPVFASRVAKDVLVSSDKNAKGILLCGSGQGMCITANRFKGIRACLGYEANTVRTARNDDDCNILCIPADTIEKSKINIIVDTFLNTNFAEADRYKRRIELIDNVN